MAIRRNRTPSKYVGYALYFYFSGLSLRKSADRLSSCFIKRNHVSVWNWIQKYKPKKISSKKSKVLEYVIDETGIRIGSELIWLWVAIDNKTKRILRLSISKERNMFVVELFIADLVKNHDKHPISTDGGTWYPPACRFLKLRHHTHSAYEKSIIERTMQYIKDRTDNLMTIFHVKKRSAS
jgi:putative transposase